MKLLYRVIALTVLAALALTMLLFTAADFRRAEERRAAAGYVLGASGDFLAVYAAADLAEPLTVTDIRLSSLRQTDREQVLRGLPAADRETLLALLEDLGD